MKITVCTGIKLRGQAWIAYDSAGSAADAIKGKQGFNFYGQPLKIAYSKKNTVTRKSKHSDDSAGKKRCRDDDVKDSSCRSKAPKSA